MKTKADNENEPTSFHPLSLATRRVMEKLLADCFLHKIGSAPAEKTDIHPNIECGGGVIPVVTSISSGAGRDQEIRDHRSDLYKKKDEDAGSDGDRRRTAEKDSAAHTRYVDQRLRELAAFEKRAGRK